jgi:nucleotide-binding universal stress UspA family protein
VSRRILVAVDSSEPSLAALALAAALADERDELVGAFVEDAAMLRIAEVPASRVVGYPSGTMRRVEPSMVRQELAALAARAERATNAIVRNKAMRVSFRLIQGQVAPEVIAAAEHVDFVVIGRASQLGGTHVGTNAIAIARGAPRPVLLAGTLPWSGGAVVIALGDAAIPSVARAVALLGVSAIALVVVVDGNEPARAELARLAPMKLVTARDRESALALAERANGPIVVGGATDADLVRLLARTNVPIVVSR